MMHTLMLIIFIICSINSAFAKNRFFEERYRGWFWFEEKEQQLSQNRHGKDTGQITPSEAKAEIKTLAKELEERKYMMLARPTVENVKAYREKEKEMWDKAMLLHDAWEMANLLYPEQRDLINNPVNVHAVKMKRAQGAENLESDIAEFAKRFDLVLFFQGGCKYCEAFSPILKAFGKKYGFRIEAVSMDGSKHEFLKTAHIPSLVEQLGIKAAPTVVAISHDSKTAFELIRGYVTLSELEEYSGLAIKHLRGEGKW
jgi:conjugal transfer pilus assembly protein TraF